MQQFLRSQFYKQTADFVLSISIILFYENRLQYLNCILKQQTPETKHKWLKLRTIPKWGFWIYSFHSNSQDALIKSSSKAQRKKMLKFPSKGLSLIISSQVYLHKRGFICFLKFYTPKLCKLFCRKRSHNYQNSL